MATLPAEDNEYPYVTFAESAAPSTPATGLGLVYLKSDGKWYTKNDAGTEDELGTAQLAAHLADATDAHDASAISVLDSGNHFTATDVEAALAELFAAISGGGIAATLADNAGDMLVASANDTWAKLATPTVNGQALQRVSGSPTWALPPGYEFDYAEATSPVSITATTEATANTIVTGNAVTYDGATVVMVQAFIPYWQLVNNSDTQLYLYDGSSSIGSLALMSTISATGITGTQRQSVYATRKLTPSAASHTYSLRGRTSTGTGSAGAGAGGNGNHMPASIRIVKV